MSRPQASLYDNTLNALGGGSRRRRRNKRNGRSNRRSQSRSRNQNQNQNQNGGFFPGLGGIVQQALVPFGLYAMQNSLKNRKSSSGNRSFMNKTITPTSFRRSFTRKR